MSVTHYLPAGGRVSTCGEFTLGTIARHSAPISEAEVPAVTEIRVVASSATDEITCSACKEGLSWPIQ